MRIDRRSLSTAGRHLFREDISGSCGKLNPYLARMGGGVKLNPILHVGGGGGRVRGQ